MKKTLIVSISLILLVLMGCASTKGGEKKNIYGTVLGDSVIELDVITEIDYEAGLKKKQRALWKIRLLRCRKGT